MSGRDGARSGESRYSLSIGREGTDMIAQPAQPAAASHTAAWPAPPDGPPAAIRAATPASAAAGGSKYSHASPTTVPVSAAREYCSWVYTLRATMSQTSPGAG